MHDHFRRTATPIATSTSATLRRRLQRPQTTTKWAVTNQLSDRRLGAFFYWTRFIWQQCTVRQYHSDSGFCNCDLVDLHSVCVL